jgi:hypothetical protein
MSLYNLPVSVTDLTQLQLGIEFLTNLTEATNEAALINADLGPPYRVLNYANQLLANNISLSQVAMAVDSLMFGVTDNITELTKLATGFLPPQVANANAHGYNPTVYAAEALGLGLAGGNLTSNAFAVNFGSLSVSQFGSEVAGLTGVNSAAIENFVQNWINFYTANPSATGSLSVTLGLLWRGLWRCRWCGAAQSDRQWRHRPVGERGAECAHRQRRRPLPGRHTALLRAASPSAECRSRPSVPSWTSLRWSYIRLDGI